MCGLCWSPGLGRHNARGMETCPHISPSQEAPQGGLKQWVYVDPYVLKTTLLLLLFQIVHANTAWGHVWNSVFGNDTATAFYFHPSMISKSGCFICFLIPWFKKKSLITYREEDEESGGLRCVGAVVAAASDWNEWNPLSAIILVRNYKAITPCGADWRG